MRVKLKDADKKQHDTSMSLEYWQKEYSKDHKYLLYDFYDVKKIVDLYEIDKKTGKEIFVKCVFESRAKELLSKGHEYLVKEHDQSNLDEYLMPVKQNQSSLSFLDRIKYVIPKIKFDKESKRHITIVVLMVVTIIAMFIIAYYQGVFN